MNKEEIYQVLAEKQDCNAKTLKEPKEDDHLSQYFKASVESANDIDELESQLKYAEEMLKRARTQLAIYETLGFDMWRSTNKILS